MPQHLDEVTIRLNNALEQTRILIVNLILLDKVANNWRAAGALTLGRQLQASLEILEVSVKNKLDMP